MFKRLLIAAAAMSLGLSFHAKAETLRMATAYSEEQFVTKINRWFAEEVAKRSDGKITISVHSNSSLYKMTEILPAVRSRQIALGEIYLPAYANDDPIYEVSTLPFLATSYDEALQLTKRLQPLLEKRLDQNNLKLLYVMAWPGQGLYSKKPINDTKDLNASKIRLNTPAATQLFSKIGAVPTVIQWGDVPQAFMTGAVEAMVTSSATLDAKPWEFLNHFYTMDGWFPLSIVVMSKAAHSRLSADLQKVISDVSAEAQSKAWITSKELDASNMDKLQQGGLKISALPPNVTSQLKEISASLRNEWLARVPSDLADLIKQTNR